MLIRQVRLIATSVRTGRAQDGLSKECWQDGHHWSHVDCLSSSLVTYCFRKQVIGTRLDASHNKGKESGRTFGNSSGSSSFISGKDNSVIITPIPSMPDRYCFTAAAAAALASGPCSEVHRR